MSVVRVAVSAVVGLGLVCGGSWFRPAVAVAAQGSGPGGSPEPAARGNVEHGRYLVERVAMCAECHSTRDTAGNIVPGTRLRGGSMPARVPWLADWPAQTPRIAGLPGYTDAEAQRLLTQGAVKRDGTQARAPMPRFRMTEQDAADVMAYLRGQ
jgi:mono/diheme cytochrome c family protein